MTPKMADDRDRILACVRAALKIEAPKRWEHHDGGSDSTATTRLELPQLNVRQWLPAVGASVADRIALFAKNSSELRTTFERVDSIDAAAAKLKEIADAEGWRRVATHAGSLTDRAVASLAIPVVRTDGGYKVEDLERCDAGVTSCDALIAQTGSVLLTSASAGGRALSILPPHHVVIATVNQLLPDLSEAYALVHERYASKWPSIMCIITGPSRTGDIERILVLGAHGPKELTVLLIAPPSKPGAT